MAVIKRLSSLFCHEFASPVLNMFFNNNFAVIKGDDSIRGLKP